MAFIYQNWRIAAASALSLAMIAGAYLLARGSGGPGVAEAASQSELLQEFASRDSNGDGVPDWEKPLYGIPLDATTTDYFHLGMTDGQAIAEGLVVPKAPTPVAPAQGTTTPVLVDGVGPAPEGSLTDAFAKEFFSLYVSAKQQNNGQDLTDDQINALAEQTIDDLESSVGPAPDFAALGEVKVSGSATLPSYAAAAEAVFEAQGGGFAATDLDLLQSELAGDTTASDKLAELGTAYAAIATGMLALPVPPALAPEHLALVNALARVGEIDSDFSRADDDALATILALEQYPQVMQDFSAALSALGASYEAAGITLPANAPGTRFLDLLESASSTPLSS